jgi:hypothetical protein
VKEKCNAENCNRERYGLKDYCRKHYLQIKKHDRLTPELEVERIEKGDICSKDECNKKVYAKGMCKYHYSRQRELEIEQKSKLGLIKVKECKVNGCIDPVLAKDYCRRHYEQYYKSGRITSIEKQVRIPNPKVCQVERCDGKPEARGLCKKHYEKFKKYGDPLYIPIRQIKNCSIEGCNNKYYAKGYCQKHYTQYIRCPKEKQIRLERKSMKRKSI